MEQIIFKPSLYKYSKCKEFAESFSLSERDLILTNEYIYAPHFGELDLPCHVVYQEKYGMGEPSDVMAEAILKDISGLTHGIGWCAPQQGACKLTVPSLTWPKCSPWRTRRIWTSCTPVCPR